MYFSFLLQGVKVTLKFFRVLFVVFLLWKRFALDKIFYSSVVWCFVGFEGSKLWVHHWFHNRVSG